MESLSGMMAFCRVVETQSFTAAARSLGISKSAVSKQVTRLEDRLGARLLHRTTRRLNLTEAGQAFYERCVRIVADVEEAEQEVSRLQQTPRGTLRVNAPLSFGVSHLAPILPSFMTAYPDVRVDLALTDDLVDVVAEGADVVVRIGALPDSSLMVRRIGSSRRVVCAAPSYWKQKGRPDLPGDLTHHDCLTYHYLTSRSEWRFSGPSGEFGVRVQGSLHANNGDVLRQAALAGRGVAALPTFICGEDIAGGRLETVLEQFEPPDLGIYAIFTHRRHLSAKVRAFVHFLVRTLGPALEREFGDSV